MCWPCSVGPAGHALSQTGGHGDMRGRGEEVCSCGAALRGLGRVCDGVGEVPLFRVLGRVCFHASKGPPPRGLSGIGIDGWLGGDLIACIPDLKDWGTLLGPLGTLMSKLRSLASAEVWDPPTITVLYCFGLRAASL
jgi:hypothetical protein